MSTDSTCDRRERVGHERRRVVVPGDDVDLLATELGDDGLDPRAPLADGGADGIEALLARGDRDLGPATGLPRDRAGSRPCRCGSPGTSSSNRRLRKPLWVRLTETAQARAGSDGPRGRKPSRSGRCGSARAATAPWWPGRLDALAHVQDHRRGSTRLTVPVDELALAVGELIEHGVALGLAEALEARPAWRSGRRSGRTCHRPAPRSPRARPGSRRPCGGAPRRA